MGRYFSQLAEHFGRGWNRFWFTPQDPFSVGILRGLVGLVALYYVLSFTGDLSRWFGTAGLLPASAVRELAGDAEQSFRVSLFFLPGADEPFLLWLLHGLSVAVLFAFTLGLFTRASSVLALVSVLSYVHRGPMITGLAEPVLTMMLFYLCLTPCGREFSLDRWLAARRRGGTGLPAAPAVRSSWANLGLRLMQVHLAGLYLAMGLSKLAGETWWIGEAVWWLISRTESRLVDLSLLHDSPYVINAWSHFVVALELVYPALIWNRLARPLLLALSVLHWLLLAAVTGSVTFAALMLIGNLAFVEPALLRASLRQTPAPDPALPAADG